MLRTHFQCGHPRTEENTFYVKRGKGKPKRPRCRICTNRRVREYRQRNRALMRPKLNEYAKKFYAKNSPKILAISRVKSKEKRVIARKIVLDHYGGKCACCGETIQEFLCVDHVFNNGSEHRKEIKRGGGYTINQWLIDNDFPDGFQLLCWNCNMAKSIYGICPHKLIGRS